MILLPFPSQGFDDQCLGIVALHLRPATFATGEVIYERGDRGNEMFFVIDGTVVVNATISCDLRTVDHPAVAEAGGDDEGDQAVGDKIVTKGDVFGEGGVFPAELGPCRRESVSALTWVSAYTLNAAALREISAEYPEVKSHILPAAMRCIAAPLMAAEVQPPPCHSSSEFFRGGGGVHHAVYLSSG